MAEEKKNPLGPVGDQVRANVERIRTARRMTKKDVSDAVGALGRPIPPLGVSRIEAGTRRVDADDLVALAVALNVSPLALLLPPKWGDDPVHLTPEKSVLARTAWLWGEGRSPANDLGNSLDMNGPSDDEAWDAYLPERQAYTVLTHPPERVRAAEHPANAAADNLAAMINRLVQMSQGENPAAARRQLLAARNRLARLQNAIEEIELELNGQDE